MKRSVAVGILSGYCSLAVASEEATFRSPSSDRKKRLPSLLGVIPSSSTRFRMAGGINTQKRTLFLQSSSATNKWSPRRALNDDTTAECHLDGSSTEADASVDLGVLESCSTNEICVANALSSMGGFCYQPVAKYTRVCDPSSSYFNTDCDCSAFNNETQTGSIQCLTSTQNAGSIYYGCSNIRALDFDLNAFQNGRYSTRGTCREFVDDSTTPTSSSSNKLCIDLHSTFGDPFAFNSSSCDMQMNGQPCTSCTISMDFPAWPNPSASSWTADCSNILEGLTVSDDYTDFPIIQSCFKPVLDGTICDLCGANDNDGGTRIFYSDNTVISLDGFRGTEDFTCGALLYANNALQISSDKCSEAAKVAQATCCVYKCDICFGRGLANATAYVPRNVTGFGETTCHDLRNAGTINHSIPPDVCQWLRKDIGDTCCRRQWGVEPTPAPNSPATTWLTGSFSFVVSYFVLGFMMSASFLW